MNDKKQTNYIAAGLAIGTAIGIAMDNLGLWISLGTAIGAAMEYARKNNSTKKDS